MDPKWCRDSRISRKHYRPTHKDCIPRYSNTTRSILKLQKKQTIHNSALYKCNNKWLIHKSTKLKSSKQGCLNRFRPIQKMADKERPPVIASCCIHFNSLNLVCLFSTPFNSIQLNLISLYFGNQSQLSSIFYFFILQCHKKK